MAVSSSHARTRWLIPLNINSSLWVTDSINWSDEMSAHPYCFPEGCWDVCFRAREWKTDGGECAREGQSRNVIQVWVGIASFHLTGQEKIPFRKWLIRFHCTLLLKARSLGQNYMFLSTVSKKKSALGSRSKDICLNVEWAGYSFWAETHVI